MTTDSSQISEREREILRLVATGATNQQIAQALNISINTVKVHLRNIFGKIGAASRTEATVYAVQMGLVSIPGMPSTGQMPENGSSRPDIAAPAVVELSPAVEEPPVVVQEAPQDLAFVSEPALPADVASNSNQTITSATLPPVTVEQTPATQRRTPLLIGAIVVATLLFGGGMYWLAQRAAGAQSGTTTPQNTTASPAARWKTRAPLPEPRSNFALTAYDNRLYVIGGTANGAPASTVMRYDPGTDRWALLTDKPTATTNVQAVTIGGRMFVPGGEGADGKVLDTFQAYDPRTNQWETLPQLPKPRSRYALATVEGRLYLFGGWDGERLCDDVLIFDPSTKQWSDGRPLPAPRRDASAVVIEGRVYVVGGEDPQGPSRANERYDPTGEGGGQWDSPLPLPSTVVNPSVVPLPTYAFAVFDPKTRTALQYTPASDEWTSQAVPDFIGISDRAISYGPSIFVFGSSNSGQQTTLSEFQNVFTTFIPNVNANP